MWKWALLSCLLTACASVPSVHVDRVQEGMDKDQVLNSAGDPKRTFRSNSQDHWIYVYYKDGAELTRQITFEDGRVIRIGKPVSKFSLTKELESTGSIEDFERKTKEANKNRSSSGFKSVDGGQ